MNWDSKNQQVQCKVGNFNPYLKTINPRGLKILVEKKHLLNIDKQNINSVDGILCDSTIHVEDARGRGNRLIHTWGIESIHICRLLASKHTMQYELMVVHSGINQTYFHNTRIPSEIF